MTDTIKDDIHDQLVKAFMEYSEANSKFELYGYQNSAVNARNSLTKITQLAKVRRQQIWEKRVALHGHKRKGIPPANQN